MEWGPPRNQLDDCDSQEESTQHIASKNDPPYDQSGSRLTVLGVQTPAPTKVGSVAPTKVGSVSLRAYECRDEALTTQSAFGRLHSLVLVVHASCHMLRCSSAILRC